MVERCERKKEINMEESKIIINDILVHEDLQKNKNKKNPTWSMEHGAWSLNSEK
jgi:aromatic ring-opening dioxygenase catalytic subunit (LigB family)